MAHYIAIPPEIEGHGVTLSGERAWPALAAANLVKFLRENAVAVVGVELWLPEGDSPRVLGFSEYEVSLGDDWVHYVEENSVKALEEIRKDVPPGSLFNLTWISEEEARER